MASSLEAKARELASRGGIAGAKPQQLNVEWGVVLYAVPPLNLYVLRPFHNVSFGPTLITAHGMFDATNHHDGVFGAGIFAPGTPVLFVRADKAQIANPAQVPTYDAVILGAAGYNANLQPKTNHPSTFMNWMADIYFHKNPICRRAIEVVKEPLLLLDKSYGAIPMDALAGDFIKQSAWGVLLHLGLQAATIGGGPLAKLEFGSTDQSATLTGEFFGLQSLAREDGHYPDVDYYHFFEKHALSVPEGLGALVPSTALFEEGEDKRYTTKEKKQQGVFRRELHEGFITDGMWSFTELPEDGELRKRDSSDKPPLGLLSERRFYNGLMQLRTAAQLALVKSPWVPILRELEKENDPENDPEKDATKEGEWRLVKGLSDEQYSEWGAAGFSKEFDYMMEKRWNARVRGRKRNWKIFTFADVAKEWGFDEKKREEMEMVEATADGYEVDSGVQATDPATGDTTKYGNLESIIRQMPDGAVVISDGYGSEIRMHRGHITISAAVDLRLLPGRDSIEMAGRNKVINAGVDLMLESANGSTYIKSENNMRLLAGNSGTGAMVIEGRGEHGKGTPVGQLNKDEELTGGIAIKTKDGLALLGSQIHVGPIDDGERLANGASRQVKGAVMIDACGGPLALMGQTIYQRAEGAIALVAGTSAAIGITPGTVNVYAKNVGMAVSDIQIVGASPASTQLQLLQAGGMMPVDFAAPAVHSNITVEGTIQVRTNVLVAGEVRGGVVKGAFAKFTNASTCSELRDKVQAPTVIPQSVKLKPLLTCSQAYSEGFPVSRKNAAKIHTGAAQNMSGFYWRATSTDYWVKSSKEGFRLYSTRWQEMLKDYGTWKEPAVKSPDGAKDTYIYPGKEAWTAGTPYKHDPENKLEDKLTSYRVNIGATQQKEHE